MGIDSGIGNKVGIVTGKKPVAKPVVPAPRSTVTLNPYTAAHSAATSAGYSTSYNGTAGRAQLARSNAINKRSAGIGGRSPSIAHTPFKGKDSNSRAAAALWAIPGALVRGETIYGRKISDEEWGQLAADVLVTGALGASLGAKYYGSRRSQVKGGYKAGKADGMAAPKYVPRPKPPLTPPGRNPLAPRRYGPGGGRITRPTTPGARPMMFNEAYPDYKDFKDIPSNPKPKVNQSNSNSSSWTFVEGRPGTRPRIKNIDRLYDGQLDIRASGYPKAYPNSPYKKPGRGGR